jgi:transposase-like protein
MRRGGETMISFKGAHFAKDIILVGVRWYVAYPLSYRHVEEFMEERGVSVDHATIEKPEGGTGWDVLSSICRQPVQGRSRRSSSLT